MGYQEEKQHQLDLRYLRMARIWAENSYCVRRKVGALIVKDKMIISDGYNGTPSGFENICEDENGKTKSYVLHAEANAITKVAKSANNCDGSTLYITAASLHRVFETHHPGRNPPGGLFGRLPLGRGGSICCAAWGSNACNTGSTIKSNPNLPDNNDGMELQIPKRRPILSLQTKTSPS